MRHLTLTLALILATSAAQAFGGGPVTYPPADWPTPTITTTRDAPDHAR